MQKAISDRRYWAAHLSKGKVQDMGECVIWHDAGAADDVHVSTDCVTHAQRSLCCLAHMQHVACRHLHFTHFMYEI